MNTQTQIIKVAATSESKKVANAILHRFGENENATLEIQAIGAHPVNQAIKAVAIARKETLPAGFDISCAPSFQNILFPENRTTTAIVLTLKLIVITE